MMGLASSAQLLVNFNGRILLPAPPAIRARHAMTGFVPARSTAQRHIPSSVAGATAAEVTQSLQSAGGPPPTTQRDDPCAAVAVVRAERAAEDSAAWKAGGFPAYLQSEVDDFCAVWDDALQEQKLPPERVAGKVVDPFWRIIQREAEEEARSEPLLSSFLHASVVSHSSFARSLAFVLANRLEDNTLHSTELSDIFHTVLSENPDIREAAVADIVAFRERDPACTTFMGALLNYKGYHAIQAHRIAHVLWNSGRQMLALALQSRVSVKLAIDIHPGARIGKGVLMDHGTGVVIGETAVVENYVSIMQNVTLGGTGKDSGVRHPHVEANVLLGAGATVLGNITIGRGAQVAANSLVLKAVPPKTMVAGSPAREVGRVTGNAALKMQQWAKPSSMNDDDSSNGVSTHNGGNGNSLEYGSDATMTAEETIEETTEAAACEGGFADWALNSLEKAQERLKSSSNGSEESNSSRDDGMLTAEQGHSFADSQGFKVEDPEPWVHKGTAGSGAEALARATLLTAASDKGWHGGQLVSEAAWSEAALQRRESSGGYWQSLRASVVGHTMDECSSSDDESEPVLPSTNGSNPQPADPSHVPAASPAVAVLAPVKAASVTSWGASGRALDSHSVPSAKESPTRQAVYPQQTPILADDSEYVI